MNNNTKLIVIGIFAFVLGAIVAVNKSNIIYSNPEMIVKKKECVSCFVA